MAKKTKLDVHAEPSALRHNPFAGLAGAPVVSAESSATAPEAAPQPSAPSSRARLILRRETKHRGGKAVVVVSGFENDPGMDAAARAALASELKRALACGGGLQEAAGKAELVLQGDEPARVAELLRARGFRVGGVTS
jgi:translation initiation factor 1 (eIF-1/SUI1)